MPRGLRAVFAALFLAAALPAFAGPGDPFPAASLSPAQRSLILSLESGRYAVAGGFLRDRKAGGAVLTVAQVESLLRGPAPSGPVTPAPPGGDDKGVARARELASGSRSVNPNFDGGGARVGAVDRGPASGKGGAADSPRAAAPDKALLQSQLLQRLVVKGAPKERAVFSRALEAILETSTGRELAAQFVAERAAAEIVMGEIPGTKIETEGGERTLSGSGGNTATNKDPPKVTLNRLYAELDPELARVTLAGTLTHELFGHALETQRAKKAGLPFAVQYYYRGDETGARLLDWMVQTELTGGVKDDDPDSFLGDPEGHYRSHWTVNEYYAITLSPAEMRDPVPALRGRLKVVAEERERVVANRKLMKDWGVIRDHFVAAHGIPRARFAPTDERLSDFESYSVDKLKELGVIADHVKSVIANWSTPGGTSELGQIRAAANSPHIRAFERRLAQRSAALIKLRALARKPSSADGVMHMPPLIITAPANAEKAPITLDELAEMHAEDLTAHPEHWNK